MPIGKFCAPLLIDLLINVYEAELKWNHVYSKENY